MASSASPTATMMLSFLDSTFWVLVIMTIVILQLVFSGNKLLSSSREQALICALLFSLLARFC
jgi:hypothetical protein